MKPMVLIYTDGSFRPTTGAGGWACYFKTEDNVESILYGGVEEGISAPRMELLAAYNALDNLTFSANVRLVSDCQYVVKCINGWADNWSRNGWVSSSGKPIKNMDIVKELHHLLKRHSVRSMWTKGHAGLRENELVDTYAQRASDNPKEYLKSRYEILTK